MRDDYSPVGKFVCIVCDADTGTIIDVYEGPMRWIWCMSQWCLRYYRQHQSDNLAGQIGPFEPVCIYRRADVPLAPL